MTNYNKTFCLLSLLYCLYFFVFPLLLGYGEGQIIYIGKTIELDDQAFFKSLLAILIFIFGFVIFDLMKLFFTERCYKVDAASNYLNIKPKFRLLFFFLILLYACYTAYQVLFNNFAEISYAVRKGEQSSNLFDFFLLNVFNAIELLLLVAFLIVGKRKLAFLFLLLVIFSSLALSTGRLTFLLNICLLILILVPIKPQKVALLTIPCVLIFMPFIFSLKEFIYAISVGGRVDFSVFSFIFKPDVFYNNFAHPLVSFLRVDELVSSYGYSFFWDYVQGFLFYLKLIGADFGLSITYYNTFVLLGVKESIIPPGYLAFGYVQLHYVGIFFAGLTYRLIGRVGEIFYSMVFKGSSESNAGVFLVAFMCASSFYHGDFRVYVMSLFFPFIFTFIFLRFVINYGK